MFPIKVLETLQTTCFITGGQFFSLIFLFPFSLILSSDLWSLFSLACLITYNSTRSITFTRPKPEPRTIITENIELYPGLGWQYITTMFNPYKLQLECGSGAQAGHHFPCKCMDIVPRKFLKLQEILMENFRNQFV